MKVCVSVWRHGKAQHGDVKAPAPYNLTIDKPVVIKLTCRTHMIKLLFTCHRPKISSKEINSFCLNGQQYQLRQFSTPEGDAPHVMIVGEETSVQFLSLSPREHRLPNCLTQDKNPINIGDRYRRRPALFLSDGNSLGYLNIENSLNSGLVKRTFVTGHLKRE